jgi:hypothetical protein
MSTVNANQFQFHPHGSMVGAITAHTEVERTVATR